MEPEKILMDWMKTPIGHCIDRQMYHLFSRLIPKQRGPYLLNLGIPGLDPLLEKMTVPFKWSFAERFIEPLYYDGLAYFNELPFPDKLFDFILLAYPGLFSTDRHGLIAELGRVLREDGFLLVFDIHPMSLLRISFKAFISPYEMRYEFNAFNKMTKIIRKNYFNIESTEHFFFRFPCQNEIVLNKTRFLEAFGPLVTLIPAGMYCIFAQKRRYSATPVVPKWWSNIATVEDKVTV